MAAQQSIIINLQDVESEMNRDELLTKLAMERDRFPESIIDPYQDMAVGWTLAYGPKGIVYLELASGAVSSIDEDDWIQRRIELINEPDNADEPEWARWKAQDSQGYWFFYEYEPYARPLGWVPSRGKFMTGSRGKIPAGHDWKQTLKEVNRMKTTAHEYQYAPEPRELNPNTSSLTNSEARHAAEETQMCSDGYPCDETPCSDCPNQEHAQPRIAFEVSSSEEEAEFQRIEAEQALSDGQLTQDMGKQARYQDFNGEDWIDEFARTATLDEFRGAMRFTIGKYNRRMGRKDDVLSEVRKMADYCRRWVDYELTNGDEP